MRRMIESRAMGGVLHGRRTLLKQMLLTPMIGALPLNAAMAESQQRIVSVGGAITETLFALKAGGRIIGVDSTSTFPTQARQLPNVGYMRTLSAEGVLALAPTHLIANEDAGPPLVLRQLAEAGVKVHALAAGHRYEGVLERTARLGDLLALQPQALMLISQLKQDWQGANERVNSLRESVARRTGGKPVSVLFVMSHSLSQVLVAGGDTAADSMLSYAGMVNPLKRQFKGYKALTSESAIAANPDVILVTQQGLKAAGGIEGVLQLPGLADTPAGRTKRVVVMDAPLLLGFGPRLPEAISQLAERCSAAIMPPSRDGFAGGQVRS